jgi:predicted transcriptional regulator
MPAATRLTIELDPIVNARLEALAGRDGKDLAELAAAAAAAVSEFVALDAAHVAGIEAAMREADGGDFASDTEVAAVFARWSAAPPR